MCHCTKCATRGQANVPRTDLPSLRDGITFYRSRGSSVSYGVVPYVRKQTPNGNSTPAAANLS